MEQSNLAMPPELLKYAGTIIDADTHESLPINHWVERYGSVARKFADALTASGLPVKETREVDDVEINGETVWKNKRLNAPGAFDFKRRLDVMDLTGVDKQIVFPGAMGLMGMWFYANAGNPGILRTIDGSEKDRRQYAKQILGAYNDWTVRVKSESSRFYPVAILQAESPEGYVAEAKRLVDMGVSGLWMPSSIPPAGISPAHDVFDPLWDVLSSSKVPLYAHVGSDAGFLKSEAWREAPVFEGFRLGDEFSLDPWTLSTNHRATENFLTTIIVGGVFDRFPNLIYAAMETGGDWVGPLAEHLDLWIQHSGVFVGPQAKKPAISMPPSEYIRRNVRVAPFGFEDVGHYVKLHGMPEIYCYQSDFPHLEGGKNPMGDTVASFKRAGLGDDVMKQFYVENAKVLLPH